MVGCTVGSGTPVVKMELVVVASVTGNEDEEIVVSKLKHE
jgi:hypothetical protein